MVVIEEQDLRRLIAEEMQNATAAAAVKPFEPLYDIQDAALLLGTTRKSLQSWHRAGTIAIVAIGGRRYVTGESLARKVREAEIGARQRRTKQPTNNF